MALLILAANIRKIRGFLERVAVAAGKLRSMRPGDAGRGRSRISSPSPVSMRDDPRPTGASLSL